jgi:hypothetical protein
MRLAEGRDVKEIGLPIGFHVDEHDDPCIAAYFVCSLRRVACCRADDSAVRSRHCASRNNFTRRKDAQTEVSSHRYDGGVLVSASPAEVQRKKSSAPNAYLIGEILDDHLVHFEVSGIRPGPGANERLYTSPMVHRTDYEGPSYFGEASNILETVGHSHRDRPGNSKHHASR